MLFRAASLFQLVKLKYDSFEDVCVLLLLPKLANLSYKSGRLASFIIVSQNG